MNNKLEVIGIDHGWSMMKTISQVFVTGVKEITTTPALFGDVLEYEGKFYKVGTVRQEVKDTKVEDDSFYLLTLAAVAMKRETGQSISSQSRISCVRNMVFQSLMSMMAARKKSMKAIRTGANIVKAVLYGQI